MRNSPLFVQSLEKGLQVLEAFQQNGQMSLPEIAAAIGISVSSAQRMVFTLEQLGYLRRDITSKRSRLTVRAMAPGYAYLANENLLQAAHAILHQLNQECGESVNLSVPDGSDVVFVMRIHTARHIPVYMPIGKRIPIYASASGRALLAAMPHEEELKLFEALSIQAHTPTSTTDRSELMSIVKDCRALGYAYADEEYFPGDVNVAAAILDGTRRPIAAVNISVPKPRWDLARARLELAPLVVRAARAISAGS